jgi:hypothetical protein
MVTPIVLVAGPAGCGGTDGPDGGDGAADGAITVTSATIDEGGEIPADLRDTVAHALVASTRLPRINSSTTVIRSRGNRESRATGAARWPDADPARSHRPTSAGDRRTASRCADYSALSCALLALAGTARQPVGGSVAVLGVGRGGLDGGDRDRADDVVDRGAPGKVVDRPAQAL